MTDDQHRTAIRYALAAISARIDELTGEHLWNVRIEVELLAHGQSPPPGEPHWDPREGVR